MPKRVLWLSRHPLSEDQIGDLILTTGSDVVITSENATFPAQSREAVPAIMKMAERYDFVCGVFPAHIATALSWAATGAPEEGCPQRYPLQGVTYLVPVSAPVAAPDGAVRGFTHSHWERITG